MPPNPTEQPAFETLTDADVEALYLMLPEPCERNIGDRLEVRVGHKRVEAVCSGLASGLAKWTFRVVGQKARKLKGGIE